jgi:hypothetical protein
LRRPAVGWSAKFRAIRMLEVLRVRFSHSSGLSCTGQVFGAPAPSETTVEAPPAALALPGVDDVALPEDGATAAVFGVARFNEVMVVISSLYADLSVQFYRRKDARTQPVHQRMRRHARRAVKL